MKRTLVIVESAEPARVEEALRAALGLTLRGAAVEVWLPADRPLTATAQRAVAVLASFGHRVGPGGAPGEPAEQPEEKREEKGAGAGGALAGADAVEVWT